MSECVVYVRGLWISPLCVCVLYVCVLMGWDFQSGLVFLSTLRVVYVLVNIVPSLVSLSLPYSIFGIEEVKREGKHTPSGGRKVEERGETPQHKKRKKKMEREDRERRRNMAGEMVLFF